VVCPVMFISAKKVSALETNELAPVVASIIKLEIHLLLGPVVSSQFCLNGG
jgi:hypothetical protein